MTLAGNLVSLADRVVGVLANNLVALDTGAKLPAVDGSQLTNIARIGVGQMIAGYTPSRAANTVYQNTSGKPIQVSIRSTATDQPFHMSLDGVNWTLFGYFGSWMTCQAVVPSGVYYKFGSFDTWQELR